MVWWALGTGGPRTGVADVEPGRHRKLAQPAPGLIFLAAGFQTDIDVAAEETGG